MLRCGVFGRVGNIWQKITVWARNPYVWFRTTWGFANDSFRTDVRRGGICAQTVIFCQIGLLERHDAALGGAAC